MPFAWCGHRLLREGSDGRVYISRSAAGWFARWLYRNLPREDANGNVIGRGPAQDQDPKKP